MVVWIGLERCAGEVITEMLEIIETCDPDEAQMRLLMRGLSKVFFLRSCAYINICFMLIFNSRYSELPVFADYLSQLRDADPAFAAQCVAHWTLYLKGVIF